MNGPPSLFPLKIERADAGRVKKKDHRHGNANTVRLGLRSGRNLLLPGEKLKDFKSLLESYVEQLRPETRAEHEVIARLVGLRWKLQRADAHEDALLRAELQRLVNESPEKKTVDMVRRALAMLNGLVAMTPTFAGAAPADSKDPLMNGVHTAIAMVDAVAVKVDLPVGVLADLVVAHEALREFYILGDGDQNGPRLTEYQRALNSLRVAAERAVIALEETEKTASAKQACRTEELRLGVRLNISMVRLLDRYRAALERSAERELEHLRSLRSIHQKCVRSFGSGLPASVPPVELRVIR